MTLSPGLPLDLSHIVLKALGVGIWDYDIDADQLHCDERWHGLLGLAPGTVTTVADFARHVHPYDVETAVQVNLQAITDLIADDRRYHLDFRVVRADGTVRWWRSVASIVVDERGHRRAVGCVTDMTGAWQMAHARKHVSAYDAEPEEAEADPHDDDPLPEPLTTKELDCLRWVSLGKTAWETATIIGRSRRTVEFHLLNAMRKLGAVNKVHAAVIAVRRKLI